jgi:site-specific DNA recombinase
VRAGIYVRISRAADGSTLGIERQEPPCRALCERNGWEIAEVYRDNDLSAFSGKRRPGYEHLLADAKAGRISAVVAWDADRLTRQPIENEGLIDLAERCGTKLATVTGEYDLATSSGRLHFRIKGAVARHESEHRGERLRLKHDELARAGRHHGGPHAFGFEYEPILLPDGTSGYRFTGRLDETEAELIREAARRLLNGESVYGVLADWEQQGVRSPKGNVWLATAFRNMLLSPRIAGLRRHHAEIVGPAAWPPILDRGTWEAVRAIFADRTGRRRLGRGRTFLLTSGIARCGAAGEATIGHVEGICGRALVSAVNKAPAYACRAEAPHYGCGRITAQRNHLEALVTEMVLTVLAGPGLADARRAIAGEDRDLAALADQLRADEHALNQLARDHYADRLISRAEFLAAREVIEARIEATNRVLSERPRTGILLDLPSTEAALRDGWETWSVDRRHAVVAAVLDAVIVSPARRGKRFDADRVTPIWRV